MKKKVLKKLVVFSTAMTLLMSSMTAFAAETTYTTKKGDSLSKIAREVYGDASKWREIYESNKSQIKDPNRLYANQTLIIPDLDGEAVVIPVPETPAVTETPVPEVTATPVVPAASENGFLQNVYNLMAAKDYAAMSNVGGSDAAEAFVASMDGKSAIYIPDGSLTGVGAGVYKFDDGSYWFFYGSYVNGVRTGNGVSFVGGGDLYEIFDGEWNNGAPNGYGVSTLHDDYLVEVRRGNLINGLWDGYVNVICHNNDINADCDLSFTANNGIAVEDLTNEYYMVRVDAARVAHGQKVYAYDRCQYWSEEYGEYMYWWATKKCTIGSTIGVSVFGDVW